MELPELPQAFYIDISEVKVNPKNPRKITDSNMEALKKSVSDFQTMSLLREIVLDEDNVILGGNQRAAAHMANGATKIPVKRFTKALAKLENKLRKKAGKKATTYAKLCERFIIADNQGYGVMDWEKVIEFGYDIGEMREYGMVIPDSLFRKDAQDDNYDVPDGGLDTDIQRGDLFEIGSHRLLCDDAQDPRAYKYLFGDRLADLVQTDPPYNVDYTGKTKDALKIQGDRQSSEQFYNFLLNFFNAQIPHVKKGGAWYVWHADSEGHNFRNAMVDSGVALKQCLIWKKNQLVMGRQDYHWMHEPCLYGWLEGATHYWGNDRKQTTILEFDKPRRSDKHPTMKPIPLIAYQIQNSTKEGDLVSDSFLGSGTTMVACEQIGRTCYGIEVDPRYCQVILERMLAQNPSLKIKKNGEDYGL